MTRPDNPLAVMEHQDRFYGGVALVVLGGPSGKDWAQLRDAIDPDVVITANGMTRLPGADYWVLAENMSFCHHRASQGDDRLGKFLHVFDRENTAEFKMINHRNFNLLAHYGIDPGDCISIRREMCDLEDFSLREYGEGFLKGDLSTDGGWRERVKVCVGTVGLQLLHLAGILGCMEVHTIGFDLMFRSKKKHHWYEHPKYVAGRFRNHTMFIIHKGVDTQGWWVETAAYLKRMQPIFERDGLEWRDHSEGLLSIEGLWCAN